MRHLKILALGLLPLYSGSVLAQDGPKLILETAPAVTEIILKDQVVIENDGSLRATPVDASVCKATSSCEGVSVSVTNFISSSAENRTITVNEGQSFSLSWASLGATSCLAQGDFNGWTGKNSVPPFSADASTAQKTVTTSAGDANGSPYELELQCKNGSVVSTADSGSKLTLVVNEVVAPSPTSCVGREPIAGWTRLTTGPISCLLGDSSADCRTWSPGLWSTSFLETISVTKKIMTNVSAEKQYVAIEFSTVGMSDSESGRFSMASAGGSVRRPPLLVTISKCPGDFNPQQTTGCYLQPLSDFNFSWRAPESSSTAECVLEPGEKYYLNMLSTSSPVGTLPQDLEPASECADAFCGRLVQKL